MAGQVLIDGTGKCPEQLTSSPDGILQVMPGGVSRTEKFSSQMPLKGQLCILRGSRQGSQLLVATCVTGDVLRRATTLSQESHWSQGGPDLERGVELTDGVSVPPQDCAHGCSV